MPRNAAPATAPPPLLDDPIDKIVLPRETGSHGDVLAVVGLADFLRNATGDRQVSLKQLETAFAVTLAQPRRPSEIAASPIHPGYRYVQPKSGSAKPEKMIDEAEANEAEAAEAQVSDEQPKASGAKRRTSKSAKTLPASVLPGDVVDYQADRTAINEFRVRETELRKTLVAAKTDEQKQAIREQINALGQEWPASVSRQDWRRYPPYLMLQGHETANKLFSDLVEPENEATVRATVQAALVALAQGRPSEADWKVSTVQVFSPNAAKGYARLKPDSTARGDKTKDAWADPFLEWMRYRGYFSATIPVFHGSKGEHIRVLTPIPQDISLTAYQQIVGEIPTPPRGTSAAKIDIQATLKIAEILIQHSEMYRQARAEDEVEDDDDLIDLHERAPSDLISALAVTNYQSLGSARAVSLMSELAVPGWFKIRESQDVRDWLAILGEHLSIVRGLMDDHSDELTLLLTYRRFLGRRGDEEGNEPALDAFLDFAGAYGNHVLRARGAGRSVRQFRADLFVKVVESMSKPYSDILKNDGFRAIAAAVRRATVAAQSLDAQGREHRTIRYGLLPDLRRASQQSNSRELLVTVAEFVELYNSENARREETSHDNKPWHRRVSMSQFDDFVRLVDDADYGAGVVGALLCAYGTCTERRPADQDGSGTATDEGGPVDGGEPAAGDPHESVEEE
ncbi:MAG: hypothetical protein IT306_04640 [Chloroflexi bacterium]|nr:hypothetical protein [Chloroflexota bacterium]